MQQVTIENPILNSPFEEPSRHFRFTDEVVEGRRRSECAVSVARTRQRSAQLPLQRDCTADRLEPNHTVNEAREAVARWNRGGHLGSSKIWFRLLRHSKRLDHERRLLLWQAAGSSPKQSPVQGQSGAGTMQPLGKRW